MPRLGISALLAALALVVSTAAAHAAPAPADPPADPPPPAAGHSLMLDTWRTPTLAEVQSWQAESPYAAIAVYVPVTASADNRTDTVQAALTSDWVGQVQSGTDTSRGWRVLPIYLGLQAPCPQTAGKYRLMSADPATAGAQGAAAADDAAASVAALGIPAATPIVYDLEAYASAYGSNPACTTAVQAFLAGWTTRLHQLGRHSGVYGSIASTMTDVVNAAADATYPKPDVIWQARWDGVANTSFSANSMAIWPTGRISQFQADVTRRYGGHPLTVDDSAVQDSIWSLPAPDGTTPVLAAPAPPRATTAARAAISWAHSDPSGIAAYTVQMRHAAPGQTLGGWSAPTRTGASSQTFSLKPGEAWCVIAQATDRAGNVSAWSPPRCTVRFADDRSLRTGKGWKHVRGGYLRTSTTASRKGAVLRGPRVSGTAVGVILRARGAVVVRIGNRTVGTVRGKGTHWLTLSSPLSGKLTLRTQSRTKTIVDGWAVTPS